jgi:hypothetical protein
VRTNLFHRPAIIIALVFAGLFLVAAPRIASAQKNEKAGRELHMCSLLSEDDVAPIVGAHQIAQETKGGTTCVWGDPGEDPNKPRLLVQSPFFAPNVTDPLSGVNTVTRDQLESSFKANRSHAFDDKTSHAKNEPQFGKDAFSALTDDGVEIIILKKTSLLNIHFLTGKRGTPENIDSIRKVAAKVAASF